MLRRPGFSRFLSACLGWIVFCSSSLLWAGEEKEPIVLQADLWFPYNGEPAAEEEGFAVELAREIFRRSLGREVHYALAPWLRAIQDARLGESHGVIAVTRDEAPDLIFPEEHLGSVRLALFARQDLAWEFNGVHSLSQVRLGVISGYDYGPEINDYIRRHAGVLEKVDFSLGETAITKNVQKLCDGSVDAIVESEIVFFAQIERMGIAREKFRKVAELGEPYVVYLAFSPKKSDSTALAAAWDQGMAKMRASGELEKVLTRYGLRGIKRSLWDPPSCDRVSALGNTNKNP